MPRFKELENYKPSIRFSDKELPELKGWEIGKKYILQIEATLKEKGEDQYSFESTGVGGRFKVESVKAIEEDKIKKLKAKYEHA